MSTNPITAEEFANRLVALCIGGTVGMPKRQRDFHILLASMVLWMSPDEIYSHSEIIERLDAWKRDVGNDISIDVVTLRRELIDSGYLTRDRAGRHYSAGSGSPSFAFDPQVGDLDPAQVISRARTERETRKRSFIDSKQ